LLIYSDTYQKYSLKEKMPRKARLDAPGTLHHVIVRGIEKRRIVSDTKDRKYFVTRMGEISTVSNTKIYAWSLLTNHAHILLRSGSSGLSYFMRRLLTGYAVTYNLRHQRSGHLFHNRYKSIVCDEDSYFQELVRYIHLNPLRARLVSNIEELERYPWCGHAVVMGNIENEWQDKDYVLSWFGNDVKTAIRVYRQFILEGSKQGRRFDLTSGVLPKHQSIFQKIDPTGTHSRDELKDERILGSQDFVVKILNEADTRLDNYREVIRRREKAVSLIEQICKSENVKLQELRSGCRRGSISKLRYQIASQLSDFGLSVTEIAFLLGVSKSSISRKLSGLQDKKLIS
jgi:REP element-mobilizing transposase RayT/DNA-binding transcriptional ArsR family regulator